MHSDWPRGMFACMSSCKHGCDVKTFCFLRVNLTSTNLKRFWVESATSLLYLPIPSLVETWKIITKHAVSILFLVNWHFKQEKSVFWKASFFVKKRTDKMHARLRAQDFMTDKNFSFNQCHNKEFQFAFVLRIKLIYKSNRKLFSCICIAWYRHSRCWENSRQLCKPSTSSRVCITVSNSPNPSCVYIRLCKHRKRFLMLIWLI